MRITEDLIRNVGLEDMHEESIEEETGNTGFFLGLDPELDEDSDQEDPELALRKALDRR